MEDSKPPFFIVGSARSGTTLLRVLLNAHPDIAVPPESWFVTGLWTGKHEIEVDDFLRRLAGHQSFEKWDLPIDVVRDELGGRERAPYAEAVAAAFRGYARTHGKSTWGDKTPRYVEDIGLLNTIFPSARFVHLVRDGRDVALSYADVPFGPKTVAKAASLWARRVEAGIVAGRELAAERYLEIRYEDFVADAPGHARTLCAFLGVPFDERMLDYTQRARDAVLPKAARYNPHVTDRSIRPTRNWEHDMDPFQTEVFEVVAGEVLSLAGYRRAYPNPSARARLAAVGGRLGLPLGKLQPTRSWVR